MRRGFTCRLVCTRTHTQANHTCPACIMLEQLPGRRPRGADRWSACCTYAPCHAQRCDAFEEARLSLTGSCKGGVDWQENSPGSGLVREKRGGFQRCEELRDITPLRHSCDARQNLRPCAVARHLRKQISAVGGGDNKNTHLLLSALPPAAHS